jgi:hypothetical protein
MNTRLEKYQSFGRYTATNRSQMTGSNEFLAGICQVAHEERSLEEGSGNVHCWLR